MKSPLHNRSTRQCCPTIRAYCVSYERSGRRGRRIGLFTAADQSIADAVGAHLDLFDIVKGSDGSINLAGSAKSAAIESALGPRYAYAGNSPVDQPIFDSSASVILAGPVDRLEMALRSDTTIEARFPALEIGPSTWAQALRLRHWLKNSLVFVPALLGAAGLADFMHAGLLFVLFGVLASGTYLINDLSDLTSDRAHPEKCRRPLAAGLLPLWQGSMVAAVAIVGSIGVGAWFDGRIAVVLCGYLLLTLGYSFRFKQVPILDVTVLAGLFTLRVVGGGVFVPVSPWLLTFSMLFFFGLAVIKRYAELLRTVADRPLAVVRGYTAVDLPLLMATGVAAGFSAVVIFTTYLITEQYPRKIYADPNLLWWIIPILLFWITRMWHVAIHGQMSEDPVTFSLGDRVSLAIAAVIAILLLLARLG